MRKTTRLLILRRLGFVLIILAVNILQNTKGFFFEPFGMRAFLLIPLVVSIGMFERSYAGALLGVLAGALWDSASAFWDGYNALILMLIAAICGLLINILMRNHLVTAMILSASACVIYSVAYVMFFIVARGLDSPGWLLMSFYLPSALYTALFTPLFYILVRAIMRATTVEEQY
ncbi:MAG: rod shape-determining protein MreD [Clostridiaceae bacterium]|nr:rod shape-determining protein MreD [Clostridiaceae bacterium]